MKELQYPFDAEYILQHKRSIKKSFADAEGLIEKKIAIVTGSTVGEIKNVLELFLLNNGIRPIFWEGEYNLFYEDIVFANEELKAFEPDIIYIHTTSKNLTSLPLPGDDEAAFNEKISAEYDKFSKVWDMAAKNFHCPVIQNNFEPLDVRILGNRDSYDFGGANRFINTMNLKMGDYALNHSSFYINDLAYEAAVIGLDKWYDHSKWYLFKYPFGFEAIPFVAFNIANIIKAIYGKNKKALALDLDNTLWGGVIGDDGVEKIAVGIESPEGMPYSALQSYVKKLSLSGIALNLCSKNDPAIGVTGFDHPSSELKADDFIVKKVNWDNKDLNIHGIASELNIGEDAIVFIDDNPAERQIVEDNTNCYVLPYEVPDNAVEIIDRSGLFESLGISEEDKKRSQMYRDNLKRASEMAQFTDYDEYLKSLNMKGYFSPINDKNIERVTQLVNKTNQFNLTTKRFSIEEVESFVNDSSNFSVCGRLEDKYGDNGIVSVIMAHQEGDVAEIILWIMSCRVFKRELELAMFDRLCDIAKDRGIKIIKGNYYRTKKNGLVADFYETIGFKKVSGDEDAASFEIDLSNKSEKLTEAMEVIVQ